MFETFIHNCSGETNNNNNSSTKKKMETVQQKDVNDNRPVFQPFANTLMLRENAPPAVILTVEATDRDQGVYGQVQQYTTLSYTNLYSFHFFYEFTPFSFEFFFLLSYSLSPTTQLEVLYYFYLHLFSKGRI